MSSLASRGCSKLSLYIRFGLEETMAFTCVTSFVRRDNTRNYTENRHRPPLPTQICFTTICRTSFVQRPSRMYNTRSMSNIILNDFYRTNATLLPTTENELSTILLFYSLLQPILPLEVLTTGMWQRRPTAVLINLNL